ncbi:S24/S26 family peptidase [Ruminococcus sp.]|uniref:S24/S26 family peptidase n=1 Tax=Ruminococcus sp. TaxID=41978 RepID=UPI00388E46B5
MTRKFEDVIAEQGKLVYTHVGDSMYPTIRKNDLLVIEAVSRPLKQYDIPLYRRDSGQVVLHRIISTRGGGWTMCGDNRRYKEYGISEKNVIGVLTTIVRGGREIAVDTPRRRLAARLLPLRRVMLLVRDQLR